MAEERKSQSFNNCDCPGVVNLIKKKKNQKSESNFSKPIIGCLASVKAQNPEIAHSAKKKKKMHIFFELKTPK